jgi:hypothetical protein
MGFGLPPVVGLKSTTSVARFLKGHLRGRKRIGAVGIATIPRPTRIWAKSGLKWSRHVLESNPIRVPRENRPQPAFDGLNP